MKCYKTTLRINLNQEEQNTAILQDLNFKEHWPINNMATLNLV